VRFRSEALDYSVEIVDVVEHDGDLLALAFEVLTWPQDFPDQLLLVVGK